MLPARSPAPDPEVVRPLERARLPSSSRQDVRDGSSRCLPEMCATSSTWRTENATCKRSSLAQYPPSTAVECGQSSRSISI